MQSNDITTTAEVSDDNQKAGGHSTRCYVCDSPLALAWTDVNRIAVCMTCNATYTLRPEPDDYTIAKVPRPFTKPEWIPVLRQYWTEHKRRIPSQCCIGGSSYERCSREDEQAFNEWAATHEPEEADDAEQG